jgi:hypothetical protein
MQADLGGFAYDGAPAKKSHRKSATPKQKQLPPDLDGAGPSSNLSYQAALMDLSLVFSPHTLGFLPTNYWLAMDVTFGDLVGKFFHRKNNANCRFPHKLYNALTLVEHRPPLFGWVGAMWITDHIFKIDKLIFGRLLGISAIDGGLFHRQGNFPSHGFGELTSVEVDQLRPAYGLVDVDLDRVRLLYHRGNIFVKGGNDDAIGRCKWITEAESTL